MEFRLTYKGRLKGNGGPVDKQAIRRQVHPQLATLWSHAPLTDLHDVLPGGPNAPEDNPFARKVGAFTFRPVVVPEYFLVAELDITFLRPSAPGRLVSNSGDVDNRIKTLLDALRMPHNVGEMPPNDRPAVDEDPFHVLLQDDSLITKLSVTTDRLLEPVAGQLDVSLMIHVRTRVTRTIIANIGLGD